MHNCDSYKPKDTTTNIIYKTLKPKIKFLLLFRTNKREHTNIYIDKDMYNLKTSQLQPLQTRTQAPTISRGVIIL
jgi:predicted phosphoadenosine phosphosulfate sulfurtransferase